MGTNIDLNALRAARAEAEGDGPTITLGTRTFGLPARMPLGVGQALMEATTVDGIRRALGMLLGPEQTEDLMAMGLTHDDYADIVMALPEAYGMSLGESEASSDSSPTSGSGSRPNSSTGTDSTSPKRAGGRTR